MSQFILGISAFYHDSAAALIQDGTVLCAAQEERFSRKKHDARFPKEAIHFCLQQANIDLDDLDCIVFYDKPFIKFERILETYLGCVPRGFGSFLKAMPVWLKEKLFLKRLLKEALLDLSKKGNKKALPKLLFTEHHQSHAASAFYPSPFKRAVILCIDGVGEWATTSVWLGENNQLQPLWELKFPDSLGLLYSAFTYYTGFKVNSGEYKLMGLAPYGTAKYVDKIKAELIDIKADGTFRLNMKYFNYHVGLTMTNQHFDQLFGRKPRQAETEIGQFEMDIARSIQVVTEEIVIKLARSIRQETGEKNLCLAGGVALNCVANGQVKRQGIFENIWIQPAAGDAGGALGGALLAWHHYLDKPRVVTDDSDQMHGAYLGPEFDRKTIEALIDSTGIDAMYLDDVELFERVAELLQDEKVIGWFQGRMEFGPRALGSRSIIGDPRSSKMQSIMNLKIKHRESFRPFAPAIKGEKVSEWFDYQGSSPYMLMVAPISQSKREPVVDDANLFGLEKLKIRRSKIPAVTHVDCSARLQTVHEKTNPRFYHLLDAFERLTQCPVLINTSFNVRGEPIVCTPKDAYRCFMRTEMDYLVLGNYILDKSQQPDFEESGDWQAEFELD